MAVFLAYAKVLEPTDPSMRIYEPDTRIIIHIELRYEGDESDRLGKTADDRPALATIKPDGTVVAGDWSPSPSAPKQPAG
jgi:hypothetical protein